MMPPFTAPAVGEVATHQRGHGYGMIMTATSLSAQRATSRQHRIVRRKLRRAAVVSILRSPRFYERLILVGIGVAAVIGVAGENQARAFARLVAWDSARSLRDHRSQRSRPA